MDFLETVAISHEHNSVDQKMIEQAFDLFIGRCFKYFEPFIKVERNERDKQTILKSIDDYVERYKKRSNKATKTRGKTGE